MLSMWNMAAIIEDDDARRPGGESRDPLRMFEGAVLVLVTVEGKRWASDSAQEIIEGPAGEAGCEPGLDPSFEDPTGF